MKRFLPFTLFFAFLGAAFAQESANNPFELRHRLTEATRATTPTPSSFNANNPFELRVRPVKSPPTTLEKTAGKRWFAFSLPSLNTNRTAPAAQLIQIRLWYTILLLILLTFLLTLFRNASMLAFAGFFNDNQFFLAYREQQGRGILPFIALYTLLPINLGSFIFFTLQYYNLSLWNSPWLEIGGCIALVFGIVLLKHSVLALIGNLFPVSQEISRYNFLIVVFGVVTGLLLAPVNILLTFGPETIHSWLVPSTMATIAFFYLFRFLRGVLIANKFLLFHRFHFLLYICTVEIAPVLNFVKLITGWNEI